MVKLSDAERHALALKIVGLSDRGEVTLGAIERLLIAYDSTKQDVDE